MHFEADFPVGAPLPRVWAFLWDVDRVARCLPGCTDVHTVAPQERYTAVLAERVGPFRVRFPVEIQVVDIEEPRRLAARVTGRDAATGTALTVSLELRVEPAGEGTRVALATDTTLLGKIAALGQGVVQQKAAALMADFTRAVRRELETAAAGDPPGRA